jgi:membrane-associated PAP2 superfamily phosphatase
LSRTGLLIVFAIAVAVGLVFGLRPDLDLAISAAFYDPVSKQFPLDKADSVQALRHGAEWVTILIVAFILLALILKLVAPHRKMLIPSRAAIFLLAALALGPGLLVNVILKSEWPRPRPNEVTQFGSVERFVAWWDPRSTCTYNCSFVAGEASSAFWMLAPASLVPPPWRAPAYAGAVLYGLAVGGLRIVMGAHYFTDVIFAGVFVFIVVWLLHGLIYRWPRTRLSEESVERWLESLAHSLRNLISRSPKA